MKELYLTITDMTFLAEGRVLGHGRTVAAAAGPEQPGDLSRALTGGTARMGTFYPAEGETPRDGQAQKKAKGRGKGPGFMCRWRGRKVWKLLPSIRMWPWPVSTPADSLQKNGHGQ